MMKLLSRDRKQTVDNKPGDIFYVIPGKIGSALDVSADISCLQAALRHSTVKLWVSNMSIIASSKFGPYQMDRAAHTQQ